MTASLCSLPLLNMTLSPNGKRVRTSKPKVKTGCVTCKARRIKCDETRPQCNRCSKFDRVCGGYHQNSKSKSPEILVPEPRILLPKPGASKLNFIKIEPPTQLLSNSQDSAYYQHFCNKISQQLSSVFNLPTWSTLILQMRDEHEFIQHALATIANFSGNIESSFSYKSWSPLPLCQPRSNNELALWHYGQFLAGSRETLSNSSFNTYPHLRRVALIVCLLTVRVETLQWHHQQALDQISIGTSLINEWLSTVSQYQNSSVYAIEDEIIQEFQLLQTQASLLVEARYQIYNEQYQHQDSESIQFTTNRIVPYTNQNPPFPIPNKNPENTSTTNEAQNSTQLRQTSMNVLNNDVEDMWLFGDQCLDCGHRSCPNNALRPCP